MSTIEVAVATVGKPHGLKGEVALRLRTDQPEERLVPGARFEVDVPGCPAVLTVQGTRTQQGRWNVRFEEISDRNGAEALRGTDLVTRVDADQEAEEDAEAWYPSQLKGLPVRHVDGHELGEVVGIDHYPAQDLLVVRTPAGHRVQLPLVRELVPEIDLEQGRVLADPPGGLFEEAGGTPG